MNARISFASYVVELTGDESGYRSITVTQPELYGDCFVRLVTETSLGISEMIQRLWNALPSTSELHRLLESSESVSHLT